MQHVRLDGVVEPIATIGAFIDGIRNGWAYLVNRDRQQFALQVKDGPLPVYAVGFEFNDEGLRVCYRVQKPGPGPGDHIYSCSREVDCAHPIAFPLGTVILNLRSVGVRHQTEDADELPAVLAPCGEWACSLDDDDWYVVRRPVLSNAAAVELGRRVGCLDPAVALRGARHPDPCPSCPPAGCGSDLPCAGVV